MIGFKYNDGGREEAGYKGKCGDCATRAIAIATGKPYKEVYKALNEICNEMKADGTIKWKHPSVRNGTPKKARREYLKRLGWKWIPTMFFGSGCKVHLDKNELPTGTLIVSVSKHLVAVIDGVINDTYDCSRNGTRCVYGYYIKEEL